MISDPILLLRELDQLLMGGDSHYSLIISGGSVVSLEVRGRETNDIDVVSGNLTEEILNAADILAQKYGLRRGWLNSAASSFNGNFDDGWQDRAVVILHGTNLVVKAISREDMIKTKIIAFYTRGFDLFDVVALKPTRENVLDITIETLAKNLAGRPDHDIAFDCDDLLRELGYEVLDESEKDDIFGE